MSLIVAARFDTFPDVENAAQRLFSEGFTKQDVHVFYVNSAGEHSRYAYGGDRRSDPDSGRADMGAILGAALFGLAFAIAGGFIVAGLNESTIAMLAAAGVGAYIGSLFGALWVTGHLARKRGEAAPWITPKCGRPACCWRCTPTPRARPWPARCCARPTAMTWSTPKACGATTAGRTSIRSLPQREP